MVLTLSTRPTRVFATDATRAGERFRGRSQRAASASDVGLPAAVTDTRGLGVVRSVELCLHSGSSPCPAACVMDAVVPRLLGVPGSSRVVPNCAFHVVSLHRERQRNRSK